MIQPEAFEALASSTKGVAKLRELILELAMRGLLVPQDPNDEPASVLLEKIAVEKYDILTDGEANKNAKKAISSAINDDEKPFDLPNGWQWSRLNDIGITNIGLTYSPNNVSDIGTPVLRSSNIQKGKIDLSDLVRVDVDIKDSLIVRPSDLLICARNGSKALVGKTAMITDLNERMTFGAFMAIYRSKYNFYVEKFLNSPIFRRNLEGVSTTTINQITQNNLKNTLIPLPPYKEQHRIVSKVNELMALCDQLEQRQSHSNTVHQRLLQTLLESLTQAVDNEAFQKIWSQIAAHFDTLFTTEASIDQLKQIILQLAVMGKLVPQDPNDEPASELLKRIQAEKAKLIAEGKIKKDKSLPLITDEEKPFELPQGWDWCRLGQLGSLMSGKGFNASEYSKEGVRLFQIANVSLGYTKWEIENFLPIEYLDLHPDLVLTDGDVLVALNRPLLKGLMKVCIISRKDLPAILYQRVGKFVFYGDAINTRYFYFFLQSRLFIEHLQEQLQGSDQPFINQSQLVRFCCSLPPLAEQHRIVNKVDELMAICDLLKNRINKSQQTQEHLATAIVEKTAA